MNIWISWDLTGLAASWVTDPAGNYGVVLEADITDPKAETKFCSSEGPDWALRAWGTYLPLVIR